MDLKRVLITGKNSYVGTNVEKWLMREPENYYVESISLRDDSWKNFDFSKFDVVFHVAGIAHIKEKKKNRDLYFKVNKDLALEVAIKAKKSNVKHFIFMSSMAVYDSKTVSINKISEENPKTFYGLSKLNAEINLKKLQENDFNICIIRPPMIYGFRSPGNFSKLRNISKFIPIFPNTKNKRSMIYITNFVQIIKEIINSNTFGTFLVDNTDYTDTFILISKIREYSGKRTFDSKILSFLFRKYLNKINFFSKIFGSFYYEFEDKKINEYNIKLVESILEIEDMYAKHLNNNK
jgi:UDP-glucose 4-epimerase